LELAKEFFMQDQTVQFKYSGEPLTARRGVTVLGALWAAGRGESLKAGCGGGVCGACTVSVRFADGRPGGTDLGCLRLVEEGMEVFPCPVEQAPAKAPAPGPAADSLRAAYPTLDRCTKCQSCTSACPMNIPVMDSVLRMQRGEWPAVAEDFTTCIHCGLCRMVCEDRVQPHNMGLWVRRSLALAEEIPPREKEEDEREWAWLMEGSREERLARAAAFRREGRVPA